MHVAGLVDLPVCGINVSEREQPTGPVVPAAIAVPVSATSGWDAPEAVPTPPFPWLPDRSEEHTSELQSLMRISYAVFCLKKKINSRLHLEKKSTLHVTHTTKQN